MMPSFAGLAAVVTGAARGIGRGTAELLGTLGARVIAVDSDERPLNQACQGKCTPYTGDLGGDQVEQLAEEIWNWYGPIDLVVNNVGIDRPLAPAEQLVHLCAEGTAPVSLLADLATMPRTAGSALDWERVLEIVQARRLTSPSGNRSGGSGGRSKRISHRGSSNG